MLLISTKPTGVFSKKHYKFYPGKPIDVTNPDDIADLLDKPFIEKYKYEKKEYIDELFEQSRQQNCKHNIGIIRFGGIGDILMLHGIVGCIKKQYPSSYITTYILEGSGPEKLLSLSQYIDNIVTCNNRDSVISAEKRLKDSHDVLYSLHMDIKKYVKGKQEINKSIDISNNTNSKNFHYQTLKLMGLEPDFDYLSLDIPEKHDKYTVFLSSQKYIVIHVGSGNLRKYKQWQKDKWDELTEYLNKYIKVIQVGMDYDYKITGAIDLRGKTDILETGYLVKNAHFVLGGDTGIIHLAYTQGTKSIVLFGPTHKMLWGYEDNYNVQTDSCSPCWRIGGDWWNSCGKNNICMDSISVNVVKIIAKQLIDKDKEFVKKKNIYDYVVCIASKDRAEMLYKLLKQIAGYKQYKIMVILINDNSEDDYSKIKKFILENKWIYVKHDKSYGKKNYWQTVSEEWTIAHNFTFKWLVQLCDDYEICDKFFEKIETLFKRLDKKSALNIWLDNRVKNNQMPWGIKTKQTTIKNYKFYETGWVDGGFVFSYDTMHKLNWRVNPISFPDEKYIHKMCSGVWEQISKRLNDIQCRVFCPEISLVNHLCHNESKMNQYARTKENLVSIGFGEDLKTEKILKVGMIARCNHTGLGIAAREFVTHIPVDSYFAVDECSGKGATFRKDWVQKFSSKMPISDSMINKWIDTDKFNVLITNEKPYNNNLYEIANKKGIKTILLVNWEWFRLGSKMYKYVDLFIAPTQYCFKMLQENGYKNSIYIPHPINTEYLEFKQRKGKPKVFLHNSGLGSVAYRKSTQEVINAFTKVRGKIKLIIRNQTDADFDINDDRIKVIKSDSKEYKNCYINGDVAIQPSKWEGVGFTILEAMSCGMPVITVDSEPMNEYPADSCLLVPYSKMSKAKVGNPKINQVFVDIKKLSQTIDMISQMDISYLSMQSRKKLEQIYSWESVHQKWIDAIHLI